MAWTRSVDEPNNRGTCDPYQWIVHTHPVISSHQRSRGTGRLLGTMPLGADIDWLNWGEIYLGDGEEGSDHRLWWHIPGMRDVPKGEPDEVINRQKHFPYRQKQNFLHDQNTDRHRAPEKNEWGTAKASSA